MVTAAFHKPYGVLSRYTPDGSAWRTMAGFGLPPDAFPAGRLDADSEGLLIVTSDKRLVDALTSPRFAHSKTYWVQIERIPTDEALQQLAAGVTISGEKTRPARVARIEPPVLPPRDPPIRVRKTVADCWIELTISEGKNRQVRKMTAAIGHPTLRLVRAAIGSYQLGDLAPGAWRELDAADVGRLLTRA
jgi:23S rRNA pseudouridine2457 synthase